MAEWLRRLTRNQFRSAGVGSNPTDRVTIFTPKIVITLSIIIFNQVYCSKNPVSTVNSGGCSVVQLAKLVRLFQIWLMDNCHKWAWLAAKRTTLMCQHRWFSGRMLACHAGGPGSIPGRCRFLFNMFTFGQFAHHLYKWLVMCLNVWRVGIFRKKLEKKALETGGIDPPTSHMLSERSTIWATSPL